MSDNLAFDISIIQRPFKTEEGEEVIRDCVELEIQHTNLELILDPEVPTELHSKAIESFIERLKSFENVKITDYSEQKEVEMENKSVDESE
ncbi:MAG: hypothetical protein IKO49_03775 [Bacilli bacterium]|nr:hypothetical protein [Clostridia bacterium]MBR4618405.1 hypothetical protein [Bacilli bacterium]